MAMRIPADRAESEQVKGQYRVAMDRAGRWLSLRARSEQELRSKLLAGGFDPDVIDDVMERLKELRLIDDLDFARAYIEERGRRRPEGREALVAGLASKGVDRAVAEAAMAVVGLDEVSVAKTAAAACFKRVADRPLAEQGPRLAAILTRRGFSEDAVTEAVRAVLPPEGWD